MKEKEKKGTKKEKQPYKKPTLKKYEKLHKIGIGD
jgi:hypothetical protein